MSRKKKSGFVRPGASHMGFTQNQWKTLEDAYGKKFGQNLRDNIMGSISAWLYRFENEDELKRNDLLQQCKKLERAAIDIEAALKSVSKMDPELPKTLFPKHTNSNDFTSTIKTLQNVQTDAETIFSDEPVANKHAYLIQRLKKDFQHNSLTVTISKWNGQSSHFNPSPFVWFVAELRSLEPRLDIPVLQENSANLAYLSQWVSKKLDMPI